ncbi:hypothetical protein V6N12_003656, partial [Hibiscus sabdariffa]
GMFCKVAEAYVVCLGLLKALNEGYRQVLVESDHAWLISQLCVKSFSEFAQAHFKPHDLCVTIPSPLSRWNPPSWLHQNQL